MTAPPIPWITRKPISIPPRNRKSTADRGEHEEGDAAHEDTLTPEMIAQRPARRDEGRQGQSVGTHHPFQARGREVKLALQDGRATLTIMTSSTITTWAVHATTRVSRCLGCIPSLMTQPCPDRPPRITTGPRGPSAPGRLVVQLAEAVSRHGAATGHGRDRAGIGLLTGIPDPVSAGARVLLASMTS
jgi:hypothetical protein